MRALPIAVSCVLLSLAASHASAGPFGGFSSDEKRYLVGRDTVCSPVLVDAKTGPAALAAPSCQPSDAAAVAAWKFRRGTPQRGREASFSASARGHSLTVAAQAAGGTSARFSWQAGDPITRVVAVYASANKRMVAVEYEVRFGGRVRVEVVGFVLPTVDSGAGNAASNAIPENESGQESTNGGGNGAAVATEQPPSLPRAGTRALKRARKAARGKRHKAALKAYRQVLEHDGEHSEARFGEARALAGQGKRAEAVRALQVLAESGRADAVEWLVEARFDQAFARLRADAGYRKATGLTRTPGRTPSLYERLVGFSSVWEQPETVCENAEVGLTFDRRKRKFSMAIISRCGGYKDRTTLRGRWKLGQGGQVRLVLPNTSSKDEHVVCTMQTCGGEDCLRCSLDADLEFVLRPVRR